MKIPETVQVILIGLFIISIPFIRTDVTLEAKDLIKVSGTLKSKPEYHTPVKGDSYGKIELREYSNREFDFHILSYSLKSLNKNNFFKEAKVGDKIKLTISKEEYENKLKNLAYPTTWQFVNVYVSTYGIETEDKVYSTFNDFNLAYEQDGKIGFLFPIAGIALIAGYLLWKRRKDANKR
jgi:hypothetical protein